MSVSARPDIKLAICVAFHFAPDRLQYLETLCANFPNLARQVDVTIITNATGMEEIAAISGLGNKYGLTLSIFSPVGLGHPYLLPWSHFPVMREKHADPSFTHFLYQEDDLLVRQQTVGYLLEAREFLRGAGLLPAILRVERKTTGAEWYATDVIGSVTMETCSIVVDEPGTIGFINLRSCYQAMYFLDRESMAEHLGGESSHPDFGTWKIRERASQGLAFSGVPEGFRFRYVVPVHLDSQMIDERCFVHHLPNTYAMNPASLFGKHWVGALID